MSSGSSLESWVPHCLSPPGKDAVILAKVNGKELPGKPTIKWFKGKWQELGSKSGARFTFKESHDSTSNVRPGDRTRGGAGYGAGARGALAPPRGRLSST